MKKIAVICTAFILMLTLGTCENSAGQPNNEPETPYTDNINELSGLALQEQRDNARPALASHVDDMGKYDVIFVGFPKLYPTV